MNKISARVLDRGRRVDQRRAKARDLQEGGEPVMEILIWREQEAEASKDVR